MGKFLALECGFRVPEAAAPLVKGAAPSRTPFVDNRRTHVLLFFGTTAEAMAGLGVMRLRSQETRVGGRQSYTDRRRTYPS